MAQSHRVHSSLQLPVEGRKKPHNNSIHAAASLGCSEPCQGRAASPPEIPLPRHRAAQVAQILIQLITGAYLQLNQGELITPRSQIRRLQEFINAMSNAPVELHVPLDDGGITIPHQNLPLKEEESNLLFWHILHPGCTTQKLLGFGCHGLLITPRTPKPLCTCP